MCRAGLPIILEPAAGLTAAESDDGIGAAQVPEHAGAFESRADHGFAPRFDHLGADKPAAPPLWRDVATILLGTAMRPGEVYGLRWENVSANGQRGLIQIIEGKTRAARRILPMVPAVVGVFQRRHEEQGRPIEGWIFPAGTKCGHIQQGSGKRAHRRALRISEVTPFEPYCLRHTALTRLAEAGVDVFTLARIAGHSSIAIISRYCHPQSDSVERAFIMGENSRALLSNGETSQELPLEVLPTENENEDQSSVQQEVR